MMKKTFLQCQCSTRHHDEDTTTWSWSRQARNRSKIDHYTQVADEVYDYVVNIRFPVKKLFLLCQIIYSWSYSKTHFIIIFSTLRFDELSRLEPLYDTTFPSNLQAFGTRCKIDEVIPGQSWSRVQISWSRKCAIGQYWSFQLFIKVEPLFDPDFPSNS